MRYMETRIPPLLLTFLFAATMYGIARLDLAEFHFGIWGTLASAVLLLTGITFCVLAVISFQRANTTVNPVDPNSTSALVTGGIYRISRNPMYVAFLLFLLAWGVYLSDLLALASGLLFVPYMAAFQIRPEERALRTLFGAAYEDYLSRVRRWL